MAKKKRKRHRHPVAPPVHSAPEAVHLGGPGEPPYTPPPPGPAAGRPPAAVDPFDTVEREVPRPRPRPAPAKRRSPSRRRRRSKSRPYVISGLVVLALVGALVANVIIGNSKKGAFDKAAAAAGCGKLRVVNGLARDHLDGQRIHYSTSPPAGGAHDSVPLTSGVYDKPFSLDPNVRPSIYQAVHSLEHAYVIVWYDSITSAQLDALSKAVANEPKVILVAYPQMPSGKEMALSAWGRLEVCGKPSTKMVGQFVKRFRGARSAPENFNA